MRKIRIDTKNMNGFSIEDELEEVLDNKRINDELKEALELAGLTIKLSLKDENTISIERLDKDISNFKDIEDTKLKKENQAQDIVNKKETELVKESEKHTDKKKSIFQKVITSSYKIFEELFDSMARKILKEKYKLNYSVYNDGKKAFNAMKENDIKTFLKKGTDSILYMFKKIPASTKKVIKSTKNKAIDEVFSWKEVGG